MKLRNKKTGEIINNNGINFVEGNYKSYNSLAELNAEWEDYDEQKEWYWFIEDNGIIQRSCHYEDLHPTLDKARKEIGNYFSPREEVELAVRKLKTWKRLRNKGFRFEGFGDRDRSCINEITIYAKLDNPGDYANDLDLLFSQEDKQ